MSVNAHARIAVLDDEPRMVEIVAMVLGREGYKVHKFARAADALAALQSEGFDLFITDLKMADLDGLEVLRTPAPSIRCCR